MVVNINFTQNESKANPPAEKESRPTPESYGITKPELKKAFTELEEKEKGDKPRTVAESRRFYRLKKYGDSTQNLASITGNKPSKPRDLAKMNQAPNDAKPDTIQKIIDAIYNGKTFLAACEEYSLKPKEFYKELEKTENFTLKKEFYAARCLLAEYYLQRREDLENDLKSGKIDPSTYSCLSSDYKYLAGKLAPLAYGDKIQLDATVERIDSAPSQSKLEQLNKLLQITDAEYEIKD